MWHNPDKKKNMCQLFAHKTSSCQAFLKGTQHYKYKSTKDEKKIQVSYFYISNTYTKFQDPSMHLPDMPKSVRNRWMNGQTTAKQYAICL